MALDRAGRPFDYPPRRTGAGCGGEIVATHCRCLSDTANRGGEIGDEPLLRPPSDRTAASLSPTSGETGLQIGSTTEAAASVSRVRLAVQSGPPDSLLALQSPAWGCEPPGEAPGSQVKCIWVYLSHRIETLRPIGTADALGTP